MKGFSQKKKNERRIMYAAGPGNILGTYEHWRSGKDDPTQISMTYSGQFYELCDHLGAKGYAIACSEEKAKHQDDQFIIEHRPIPWQNASGLLYHIGYIWYGLSLVLSSLMWRADALVVSNGSTHWFVLLPLKLLGVEVIPTIHCLLWAKYLPRKKTQKIILSLDSYLLSNSRVLVASKDIAEQLESIAIKDQYSIVEFLPTYKKELFEKIAPPRDNRSPFKLIYIGRIERDKGIFDLLEVAKKVYESEGTRITFDICGKGSASDELSQRVKSLGLESTFKCHGHCNQDKLQRLLSESHVVIVPTKTSFIEGFNQVVAEGILAGRPVITSSVCPALNYVKEAIFEVAPDDVEGYYRAILELRDRPELYEKLMRKTSKLREQFYDPAKGWKSSLETVLLAG